MYYVCVHFVATLIIVVGTFSFHCIYLTGVKFSLSSYTEKFYRFLIYSGKNQFFDEKKRENFTIAINLTSKVPYTHIMLTAC